MDGRNPSPSPGRTHITYWVDRTAFQRNAGFRMDFLLLSPSLASTLQDANVDSEYRGREGASDHAPTWIILRGLPGKKRRATSAH
jgi:exodeoxyribonuclease-3